MKIDFSKNHNGKLDWPIFTTIRLFNLERLNWYQGYLDYPMQVTINDKPYGKAILCKIDVFDLERIPKYLKELDGGMKAEYFDDLMKTFYGKKTEWKDGKTRMMLLWFINCKTKDEEYIEDENAEKVVEE